MQTSVSLQNPFSYSLGLTIALIALVLVPMILLIYFKIRGMDLPKFRLPEKKVKEVPVIKDPAAIKSKYLAVIDRIQDERTAESIDDREAYIRLSSAVRSFVNELTGANTRNLSLAEIEGLGMPNLYNLIKDFYHPEFAYDAGNVDITKSFGDARTVIKEWN
ncbi:MAG: hypothetical protein IJ869_03690 [Clostridiales bacterium]|nr:hypothetical protein [Clostridiales bacterium]HAW15861.1 hypothetical protein [Clostridiales bacterium]